MSGLDDLSAQFEAHRVPVLATAAAAVVGFALYKRKQAGGNVATPAQGGTPAGGFSAGAQAANTSGANGVYDSTASDLYGAIEPQLESLSTRLNAVPVTKTPAPTGPLAASMYAPDPNNHNWIVMPNGVNGQVEGDGSIFGATAQQFFAAGGAIDQRSPMNQNLDFFSTERNTYDAMQSRINTASAAASSSKTS